MKIALAMSGGVDSSVAGYLLKKNGYEVLGIFMQNWDEYLSDEKNANCNQAKDWKDAREAAEKLQIPIFRVEFIKEYWDEVFQDFIEKIKEGITPNPDINCNRIIKFNYFVNYVKKNFNIELFATGHYAKILEKNEKKYLAKPKDEKKDQTYFLCQIDKVSLKNFIFPLSELKKTEVREEALKLGLKNAKKKDSVGICFIGEKKFGNFLSNYIKNKSGEIIKIENGDKVGKHEGTFYFTLGQRKGLKLKNQKFPNYVVAKDIEKNIVYVAENWDNEWLYSKWCLVKKVNWLIENEELESIFKEKILLKGKFRYGQKEIQIRIERKGEEDYLINFLEKQRSITPGQFAVFYHEEICLGGGLIWETEKNYKNSAPKFTDD